MAVAEEWGELERELRSRLERWRHTGDQRLAETVERKLRLVGDPRETILSFTQHPPGPRQAAAIAKLGSDSLEGLLLDERFSALFSEVERDRARANLERAGV